MDERAVWAIPLASLGLTWLALVWRSWAVMWAAAVLSVVISFLGLFTIGAFTFLPACLQFGIAIALRRSAPDRGWMRLLLLAGGVWIVVVPAQILAMVAVGRAALG